MRLTSTSKAAIPNEVSGLSWHWIFQPRWGVLALPLLLALAPTTRAEYIVLRSGERIHVTGYQVVGDKYRLQLQGGWVDVQTVSAAASRYGVDAELISSVMEVESHFDAKAVSPKNARGLMQLLPQTAARLGVKDIFDPQQNIEAGTRYLKELLDLYKNNLTLALAAYNAGPDKVQKYGDVPPYRETVSYVNQVKRKYQKSKSAAAAKTATPAAPKARASASPAGASATPPSPPPSSAPKTQDP